MNNLSPTGDETGDYLIALDEKPCTVSFVNEWSSFIVGTYILLPTLDDARSRLTNLVEDNLTKQYEKINHRAGSLILLAQEEATTRFCIKDTLSCSEGGVFDLSVLNGVIYVAHANNTIGLYEYEDRRKLTHLDTIRLDEAQTSTTLLTSIDTCCVKTNATTTDSARCTFIVVGDSQGFVTVLDASDARSCKILVKSDITKSQDPVWCVKFAPTNAESPQSSLLLIVGCENSCWYIQDLDLTKPQDNLVELFKKEDFTAGVTSICFGPWVAGEQRAVILGSYNEHLKLYALGTQTTKRTHPKFLEAARITGSGIWRMKPVENDLYIAGMYAGSYKAAFGHWSLSPFTRLLEGSQLPSDQDEHSGADGKNNEASLHYDIDVSLEHKTLCVVDFNKSMCILSNKL